MAMRGVEKQNSYTITSAMLGAFRDHGRTRMEFLELLKHKSPGLGVAINAMAPAGASCLDE
jgi:GTP cyclohydrolase I